MTTSEQKDMIKHEGVTCKNIQSTSNSLSGAKASCKNNPNCYAVEQTSSKPKYCVGETKKDGLVNLEEKAGKIVWIKGKHQNIQYFNGNLCNELYIYIYI